MFRYERFAYLALSILAFTLIAFCIVFILVTKGAFPTSAMVGLFGPAGVVTLGCTRVLIMWQRAIDLVLKI
jgi:hypothetical protein